MLLFLQSPFACSNGALESLTLSLELRLLFCQLRLPLLELTVKGSKLIQQRGRNECRGGRADGWRPDSGPSRRIYGWRSDYG